MPNGLRLTNDNDEYVYVGTLRDYRDAVASGYYPLSNAEMKTANIYFDRHIDVLEAIQSARVADLSFIDDPLVDISNLGLMPASLVAGMRYVTDDPAFAIDETALEDKSIFDLVEQRYVRVAELQVGLVAVENDEMRTFMFEMMRGDFNRDGIQDIFIHYGYSAIGGSLSYGSTLLLTRTDEHSMFQPFKLPQPYWRRAGDLAYENARLRREIQDLKDSKSKTQSRSWKHWFGLR